MTNIEQQKGEEGSPGTVLIVDDNPLITTVLRSLLQAEHYHVLVANNGEEALSLLEEGVSADVVICDVMMPKMDGYAFHESLRKRAEYAHIPFVFLTALSDDTEVQRGLLTGADVYLTKPFDPRQIVPLIHGKVLRSRTLKQKADEQFDAYRKRVVNTLSHEFRTPLVAITTGSELLMDHGERIDPAKAKNLLEAIRRGGQRLERLVTDFMLLQQLDSGVGHRMYVTRGRPVEVQGIVERAVERAQATKPDAGAAVHVQYRCEGAKLYCYEPYLEDAIYRLLDNAIKFSRDHREVELRVWAGEGKIHFEVADRGVGIDPTQIAKAIELFGQLDREKLEQQGSGMGLALVSRFMRIHGGTLACAAREGGGSVFRLAIPLKESPIAPA